MTKQNYIGIGDALHDTSIAALIDGEFIIDCILSFNSNQALGRRVSLQKRKYNALDALFAAHPAAVAPEKLFA